MTGCSAGAGVDAVGVEEAGDGVGADVASTAGVVACAVGSLVAGGEVAQAGAAVSPVKDAAAMSAAASCVAIIRLRFIVSFKERGAGSHGAGPSSRDGELPAIERVVCFRLTGVGVLVVC